jgi:hypothetical protein
MSSVTCVSGHISWEEIITGDVGLRGSCGRKLYQPQKFRTALSGGKQMTTAFWDMERIVMVEWLPQRTTVEVFLTVASSCLYWKL